MTLLSELFVVLNIASDVMHISVSGTDSESKQKREEASLLGESVSHDTQGSLALE